MKNTQHEKVLYGVYPQFPCQSKSFHVPILVSKTLSLNKLILLFKTTEALAFFYYTFLPYLGSLVMKTKREKFCSVFIYNFVINKKYQCAYYKRFDEQITLEPMHSLVL